MPVYSSTRAHRRDRGVEKRLRRRRDRFLCRRLLHLGLYERIHSIRMQRFTLL